MAMADEPIERKPGADGGAAGSAPAPETGPRPAGAAVETVQACATTEAGQPIVVNVQVPKRSNAPTVVLCVLVAIVALALGSCAFAGSTLVGGVGSMIGAVASSAVDDGVAGVAWEPSVAIVDMGDSIASDSGVTPRQMRETFAQIEADDNIRAVLVVCNSPGGEAAPSWDLSRIIADCSKPVVFSVSSMCASGAYMAASQADWIVAGPMSDVGAIGVYMQTYDASGLLDMLGISSETIKSADMKDMGSVTRPLTDEETAYLQDQVDTINRIFIDMVAEGRGVDPSEVEEWATGTTYLGDAALEMGMIDQVGTYGDALAKAAELGGLPEDCPTVQMGATSNDTALLDLLLGE